MKIAIGCDHAGFPLKGRIVEVLQSAGHEVIDCGTNSLDACDYPVFARRVAETVAENAADRGIALCGSGVGVAIAANKVPGVRACLCHDCFAARQGVEHDNMNVLCLGARVIGPAMAVELVNAFLSAEFSRGKRHLRRLEQIEAIERDYSVGE